MAADADVVIRSSTDPLLFLEFHRHFTHSLIFIPLGALLCALPAHYLLRHRMAFRFTFLASLAGYASHGLLDACTAYGTMLLWPFSNARIAWNNVSVIDPLFTIPVAAFALLAAKRKRPAYAAFAIFWAIAYLGIGYVQMLRAVEAGAALAASRGHAPQRARAMPSIANLWLWRHIYEHDGRIYADAIRVAIEPTVFEGSSLRAFTSIDEFSWLDSSGTQALDLQRFGRFADGYLGITQSDPNRIVDLRYSALPNEVTGVWSITLDKAADPDAHVGFVVDRGAQSGQARRLFRMLFL
jgi:inner membrane protein